MPGIDFPQLKLLLDAGRVVRLLGLPLRTQTGRNFRGPCPLCGAFRRKQKPPPFSVAAGSGAWLCSECKAHGSDAVGLYAALRGVNQYQAARELCGLLGVAVPYLQGRD